MKSFKTRLLHIFVSALLVFLPGWILAQETNKANQNVSVQSVSDRGKGYIIIEGDILIPAKYKGNIIAATWDTKFWPGGIVPFEFDANVTSANQQLMLNAMAEWENVANGDFILRTDESNFIHIQSSDANNSFVGMRGGSQDMNIFNWNLRFIMAHELGHALGYWHEQSRPDRDNYIFADTANVERGEEKNFDKHEDAGQYGPYDFDSVMHYGQFAFSRNGQPTITVLAPNQAWQNRIGQTDHLSRLDALTMSFLYSEPNWVFVDINTTNPGGGTFLGPFPSFGFGPLLVPAGGTVWVQPGSYSAIGTYTKNMTIQAPLGGVTLGN